MAQKKEKAVENSSNQSEQATLTSNAVENQNQGHNIKKQALGPNTKGKR